MKSTRVANAASVWICPVTNTAPSFSTCETIKLSIGKKLPDASSSGGIWRIHFPSEDGPGLKAEGGTSAITFRLAAWRVSEEAARRQAMD